MNRFDKKVVIITNADTVIGAATAKRFLSEGATVALNIGSDEIGELKNLEDGPRVLMHEGDVSQKVYIEHLIADTVSRFGRVDVLVNNIQPATQRPSADTMSDQWGKVAEQWHQKTSNDADCVFLAVQSALPHLLQTKGAIVNVSLAGDHPPEQQGSQYNSVRSAVRKLTRTAAYELASQGVRVNVVSPRLTSLLPAGNFENNDTFIIPSREPISVGRVADADEIAGVVTFLASEDAAFVNGVDLPVDGGFAIAHRI